jgi:hypothetical protein
MGFDQKVAIAINQEQIRAQFDPFTDADAITRRVHSTTLGGKLWCQSSVVFSVPARRA